MPDEKYFISHRVLPKPTALSPQIVIQDLNKEITIVNTTPPKEAEENFFKYLEQKDVICKQDQRLGSMNDGGWNVCFSPPFGLHKPCIVYSFGIGTSWNFDDAASKIYGCRVLSFDPSLKDLHDHNRTALIAFKKIGIGDINGTNHYKGWRMKTLTKFIHDEGHDNTVVDYVKFDVEFDEWRVLLNILQENALKNVKQIGFEIHTKEFFKFKKNPRLETHSTQGDYLKMFRILKELEKANFRQFNYRLNPFGEFDSKTDKKKRSCCYELHYINMNFVSQKYTVKQSDLTANSTSKTSGLGQKVKH
ncbi:hypothetical protein FSP39_006987 [Pinctada imbricata]|uniref:Methyltransferase domain-containing protein n=1 Tax=Pinctada imbricata TaxID=66713 RepID=A0AA88XVD7_PINIB|nr:hypothetical protein FSP39_006987 [Pinctada imbricata]